MISTVDRLRLEIAVGAVVFAALVIAFLSGLSPQDWAYWYAIPGGMVALGLLFGKRAFVCFKRGRQTFAFALGSLATLLTVSGSWIAWEHYVATPLNMGGHIL